MIKDQNLHLGAGAPLKMADPFGRRIYYVNFSNGSLNPGQDVLGIGPLRLGNSNPPNPITTPTFVNDELFMSVTLPNPEIVLGQPGQLPAPQSGVTSGVFAIFPPFDPTVPDRFNTQLPFALRGTYVAPVGDKDGTWAVGILARDGGVDDLSTNTQVVATLQFRPSRAGPTARLNVPLGAIRASRRPVPLDHLSYNAITDPNNPRPFTLALWVDRISAVGTAYLTVEGQPTLSTSFQLLDFQANSGPAVTAVGTVISNLNAIGETMSVRVRDFGIYETT